ncbi:oligopeptide transporter [Ramicandelaber brevisporus]|nr:oligopeptide transporter [Ramicandelaber brevisporus]
MDEKTGYAPPLEQHSKEREDYDEANANADADPNHAAYAVNAANANTVATTDHAAFDKHDGHDNNNYNNNDNNEDDDDEDSPFFEVRAAVSNKDDPRLPSLTFRVWFLGFIFTVVISFVNQLLFFRNNPVLLPLFAVQVLAYPAGKLLQWALPRTAFSTLGWTWSLNPAPFSIKEHVLISVFANAGTGFTYAIEIVVVRRMFYFDAMSFGQSLALCLTTQLIGYGLAGLARQFLVYPASMIWPANLVNVVLFRAFHEHSAWSGWSRTKMFWVVFAAAFAWYWVPGVLFTMLSIFSVLCFINRESVLLGQLFDGGTGLGIMSLTLDWSIVTAFAGSPIATPFWALCNMVVGFVLYVWVITPALYYTNTWDAQRFPIYAAYTFDKYGNIYNTTRIITKDLHLNVTAYNEYSPLRMPPIFALSYGLGFASLTAVLVHIALHHGKEIVQRFRDSRSEPDDIHMKLMCAYPEVPVWWYAAMYAVFAGLGIACGEAFGLQVKWYAFLLAMALPLVFLIPIGMVAAVTNQPPGLNIITELIFGYVWPGNPIGNVTFKTYGYITMAQALFLLGDLKLGHYMKIPPRHLFICQTAGTVLTALVQLATAFFVMDNVKDICVLEPGNAFNCRMYRTFHSASVVWGLISAKRTFNDQDYGVVMHGFWLGAVLPVLVYLLQKRFKNSWVKNIYTPLVLGAAGSMPGGLSGSFVMWAVLGFVVNYWMKRRRATWWERYAFTVSAGLDAGTVLSMTIAFFALGYTGASLEWAGNTPVCLNAGLATIEPTEAPPPS